MAGCPCPYCPVKGGDLHKPIAYRCVECKRLDKVLDRLVQHPELRKDLKTEGVDCFRWNQLYEFKDHLKEPCCHNEVLTSEDTKKYETDYLNDDFYQGKRIILITMFIVFNDAP